MINNQTFYTLILAFLCFTGTTFAQINGNKNIQTRTFDYSDIQTFELLISAQVTIDGSQDEAMKITTDENIFEYLDIKNTGKKVSINQAEWIEFSKMEITFGSTALTKLITSGYGNFTIKNIYAETFTVINPVGTVSLNGKADNLVVKTKIGKVDAKQLTVENADISIADDGEVTVNASESVVTNISEEGIITYVSEPAHVKTSNTGEVKSFSEIEREEVIEEAVYIELKVQNNTSSRKQFYIKGPKNRRFSYGFPMNAYQKRAKNVPVGTKIYQVNKLGAKTLLVTIEADDEGQVVKLFDNEEKK